MRICTIVLITLACTTPLLAQELYVNCAWEVYVGLSVEGDTYAVSATSAANEMWNASFSLTDSVAGSSFSLAWTDDFEEPGQPWPYGFDFIGSIQTAGYACTRLNPVRFLPYGLFRITFVVDAPEHSVYLDLRDDRWCHSGMPSDMWLRFDESTGKFDYTYNGHDTTYDAGSTIRPWLFYEGTHSTSHFQPTSPQNLILTNSTGHPILVWNRSVPIESARYRVYRNGGAITSALADTVYTDYDVVLGSGVSISYKVRAFSGDDSQSSVAYSNTVSTTGSYAKIGGTSESKTLPGYALDVPYPNPSNPSPHLTYVVAEAAHVRLTVVDILGREVAILVEGIVAAGTHEVVWQSAGAAAGVYFFRMTVTNDIGQLLYYKTQRSVLVR